MTDHEVRVATRNELEVWLRSNIQPDQTEAGWIYVVCPDKIAKESSVVSELRARGWKLYIREWDYDSEDDPRADGVLAKLCHNHRDRVLGTSNGRK